MIITRTRTGFRTKRKKNETKLYSTCILQVGLFVNHMHILIIFKSLSFNNIFMDYIK